MYNTGLLLNINQGGSKALPIPSKHGTTDDDAEAEAEAKTKRSRTPKCKLGEKGKKGEPMFTRKQFEALLEKERSKINLPATPTRPTPLPLTDARDVPAQGLRSIQELDPAGRSALRASAQIWVKSELTKGRIDHTKKWKDQAGVGEPESIISKSLYSFAALKNAPTSLMEKMVSTYCESRYVTLTSVWHDVSDLVRTR